MKLYGLFFKNGLLLTISTIILKTMSILFSVFLSNTISSYDLGCFSILMSIFSFFLTISISGINLSSTRLISQEQSFGKEENSKKIMINCFIYCLFFSFLSIIVLLASKNYILKMLSQKSLNVNLIYILAMALPFCSISSCLSGYFMAKSKIKNLVIAQLLELVVHIAISIMFHSLGFFNTTYSICKSLILSIIISDIVSAMYSFYIFHKDMQKYEISKKYCPNYMKKIIKISLPVALTSYIKSALSTIKTTIIPIAFIKYGLSSEEALSYHGIISGTVLTLLLFPFTFIQSYNGLLVPKLSSYNPKKSIATIKKIAEKSLRLTLIFSLIITFLFLIFAEKINTAFYSALSITYYIKVFAPIIIYIYLDNVIDSILKSLDCQIYVVIINIIDVFITTLLINLFIPKFGLTAYILILYISEVFNFLTSYLILKRKIYHFEKY